MMTNEDAIAVSIPGAQRETVTSDALAKATPRPWREKLGVIVSDTPCQCGVDKYDTTAVAYIGEEYRHAGGLAYGDAVKANAALIVAAVNACEPMREALKIAREALENDVHLASRRGPDDAIDACRMIEADANRTLTRIAELVPEMGE